MPPARAFSLNAKKPLFEQYVPNKTRAPVGSFPGARMGYRRKQSAAPAHTFPSDGYYWHPSGDRGANQ
jgi:hypothetical protein